jgi:hypothetical protein
MVLLRLTLLSVFFLFAFPSFSQDAGTDIGYIRIRLNDLTTTDQEVLLDEFMRSKPGVLMSRTDRNTDVFFAHYSISSGLTETDFISWIQSVGFHTGCVVSGLRDGMPPKDFPKDCATLKDENKARTH